MTLPTLIDTAAAVPAPWPVTVQAIMFLIAAWLANSKSVLSHVTNETPVLCINRPMRRADLVLSPATALPATRRLLTLGGTQQP